MRFAPIGEASSSSIEERGSDRARIIVISPDDLNESVARSVKYTIDMAEMAEGIASSLILEPRKYSIPCMGYAHRTSLTFTLVSSCVALRLEGFFNGDSVLVTSCKVTDSASKTTEIATEMLQLYTVPGLLRGAQLSDFCRNPLLQVIDTRELAAVSCADVYVACRQEDAINRESAITTPGIRPAYTQYIKEQCTEWKMVLIETVISSAYPPLPGWIDYKRRILSVPYTQFYANGSNEYALVSDEIYADLADQIQRCNPDTTPEMRATSRCKPRATGKLTLDNSGITQETAYDTQLHIFTMQQLMYPQYDEARSTIAHDFESANQSLVAHLNGRVVLIPYLNAGNPVNGKRYAYVNEETYDKLCDSLPKLNRHVLNSGVYGTTPVHNAPVPNKVFNSEGFITLQSAVDNSMIYAFNHKVVDRRDDLALIADLVNSNHLTELANLRRHYANIMRGNAI